MKNNEIKSKRVYKKPEVTAIQVDHEISLAMTSPPAPPIYFTNPIKFLFK